MDPKVSELSLPDEADEVQVRCHHIARWWWHAAWGRVTPERAMQATVELYAAIDRLVADG